MVPPPVNLPGIHHISTRQWSRTDVLSRFDPRGCSFGLSFCDLSLSGQILCLFVLRDFMLWLKGCLIRGDLLWIALIGLTFNVLIFSGSVLWGVIYWIHLLWLDPSWSYLLQVSFLEDPMPPCGDGLSAVHLFWMKARHFHSIDWWSKFWCQHIHHCDIREFQGRHDSHPDFASSVSVVTGQERL